jgi:uncharacterized protein (DUF488 family)
MSSKNPLFTMGYSGHDQESFLHELRKHQIEVVIDVRQRPLSRKKGFSRSSLSEFLVANNVDYRHEAELGVPPELRSQLKAGNQDLNSYFSSFRDYLTQHVEALDRVYAMAVGRRCCLICLEHLPGECHRSVVADSIEARNGHRLRIMHV